MIVKRKQKEFVDSSYKHNKNKRLSKLNNKIKKITDKEKREETNISRYSRIASKKKPVKNKTIENKLINEADSKKVPIIKDNKNLLNSDSRNSGVYPTGLATSLAKSKFYRGKATKQDLDEFYKTIDKSDRDYLIRHPSGAGIETLSHELGHIDNIDNGYPKHDPSERLTSFQLKDETRASEIALKNLKAKGASKQELRKSRQNLKAFKKTYESLDNKENLSEIKNRLVSKKNNKK